VEIIPVQKANKIILPNNLSRGMYFLTGIKDGKWFKTQFLNE